jgi:hypothetical protein
LLTACDPVAGAGLLEAANGAMPPNHVIDIAEAMHGFLVASPELGARWLAAAASQHKSSVSEKALSEFVSVAISAFARLGACVCWSERTRNARMSQNSSSLSSCSQSSVRCCSFLTCSGMCARAHAHAMRVWSAGSGDDER